MPDAVARRKVVLNRIEQVGVAAGHDYFGVREGDVGVGVGLRESSRGLHRGILHPGMTDVDTRIDQPDLDSGARFIESNQIPGLRDLVQPNGVIELQLEFPRLSDTLHAGDRRHLIHQILRHAHDQRVRNRLRAVQNIDPEVLERRAGLLLLPSKLAPAGLRGSAVDRQPSARELTLLDDVLGDRVPGKLHNVAARLRPYRKKRKRENDNPFEAHVPSMLLDFI